MSLSLFQLPKLLPFISYDNGSFKVVHGTPNYQETFDSIWGKPIDLQLQSGHSRPDLLVLAVHRLSNIIATRTYSSFANMLIVGDEQLAKDCKDRFHNLIYMPELHPNEPRATLFKVNGPAVTGGAQFIDGTLYLNLGYNNYFTRAFIA